MNEGYDRLNMRFGKNLIKIRLDLICPVLAAQFYFFKILSFSFYSFFSS